MSKEKQEAFETFEFDLPPIRGFPELRWAGKRPFRSTQYFPAQKKEAYGDPTDGWWNRIYWGDNLQVMSHLLREFRGKIDLIYIDPPFDSSADYNKLISIRGARAQSSYGAFEERQYTDIWSNDSYAQFLYERITLLRELLSDTGTIFFHCDQTRSHHIRCILDEVFGPENFISEVAWKRTTAHGDAKQGSRRYDLVHDNIVAFKKSSDFVWNTQYIPFSDAQILAQYNKTSEDGRKYRLVTPTARKGGGDTSYEFNGVRPPEGRYWAYSREKLQKMHDDGLLYYSSSGQPYIKYFLDERPGVGLSSVWTDILLAPTAKERVGYPTQKPEALLERILLTGSNPGDLIFDAFMGSGTTQAVAAKLGRRYIGADINLGAIETTVRRLNGVRRELESAEPLLDATPSKPKKFFGGFEVYNVNNYDLFRNPDEAVRLIREAMELQPLSSGSIFDGQREEFLVKIMPVNRIANRADLNEIINGLDYKAFESRVAKAPNKPVERIHLVCMGHEPDLGSHLVMEVKKSGFDIDVIVTDLIRDKAHLHFKRASDARLKIERGYLVVTGFYPMNLLQKLSLDADAVEDWRQLVESVKIDWNYDGAVLTPATVDAPEGEELVAGRYRVPGDASTIRVKITDVLSESWEGEILNV